MMISNIKRLYGRSATFIDALKQQRARQLAVHAIHWASLASYVCSHSFALLSVVCAMFHFKFQFIHAATLLEIIRLM